MNRQITVKEFISEKYITYNSITIALGRNETGEYLYKLSVTKEADSIAFYTEYEKYYYTLEQLASHLLQTINDISINGESTSQNSNFIQLNSERVRKSIRDIQKLIGLIYFVFSEE